MRSDERTPLLALWDERGWNAATSLKSLSHSFEGDTFDTVLCSLGSLVLRVKKGSRPALGANKVDAVRVCGMTLL